MEPRNPYPLGEPIRPAPVVKPDWSPHPERKEMWVHRVTGHLATGKTPPDEPKPAP